MLLNNVCEVFNGKIVHGRDKPIISCLEYIREYLMRRVCTVQKIINKCQGPLSPFATKILDTNIHHASHYTARWNGQYKYQVRGEWNDQHVVDMGQRTCSCRKWELTGIPCKHVIAALHEMAAEGEHVGEMYTYVHKVYWVDTWKEMYSFKIDPIKGRVMWPKSDVPTSIRPPPHHKQPGRPRKKRRQSAEEKSEGKKGKQQQSQSQSQSQSEGQTQTQPQGQKLSRKFVTVHCRKCGNKGHNARTCKGQGGNAGASGCGV